MIRAFKVVVFALSLTLFAAAVDQLDSWASLEPNVIETEAGLLSAIKSFAGALANLLGFKSGSNSSGQSGSTPQPYLPPSPTVQPVTDLVGLTSTDSVKLPNAATPKITNASCVTVTRNVATNSDPGRLLSVDDPAALTGVRVTGAPLADSPALTDLEAIQKYGEPSLSDEPAFQVFVPTNSDTEVACFRGMSAAQAAKLSLTITPCSATPASSGGPGKWVQVASSGESQAAACARIGSTPYATLDKCGICASVESRPMDSCGDAALAITWPSMAAKYANFKGGGGQVAPSNRYCYKRLPHGSWDQKQDSDSTDRILAWRCEDTAPASTAATDPGGGSSVITDCSKVQ